MLRIVLILLFIAPVTFLYGQQGQAHPNPEVNKSPEKVAETRTNKMAEGLGLSASQKTKVYNLNLKYAKKRQTLHQSQFYGDEERRKEKQQMGKNYNEELKTILNAEQYEKFTQYRMDKKRGTAPPSKN